MTINPFEVTKAVDFTDSEILHNWVHPAGLESAYNPSSPMPIYIVSGKGGGRTHLMRHHSFALQRLRSNGDTLATLQEDGYLGVYLRLTGLNAGRFKGKGIDQDGWQSIFAYYMDLWLGQHLVGHLADLADEVGKRWDRESQERVVRGACAEFDPPLEPTAGTFRALAGAIAQVAREMDREVNNAALRRRINVDIHLSPGQFIFALPRLIVDELDGMSELKIAYLLDEYENLYLDAQKYINTLVREKELPSNIVVGTRRQGLRTHETFSGGEINVEGSEFELLDIEKSYASRTAQYERFLEQVAFTRLRAHGVAITSVDQFDAFFEQPPRVSLSAQDLQHSDSDARKQFKRLARQFGLIDQEIDEALDPISSRLGEQLAFFLSYRWWADGQPLSLKTLRHSVADARALADGTADTKLQRLMKHWRDDLVAQVRRKEVYWGMGDLCRLSGFLPRNILMILKSICRNALLRDEEIFTSGSKISLEAQARGIQDASDWFLTDQYAHGGFDDAVERSIRRLGSLLREIRFSPKPPEVSVCAFSTNRLLVDADARDCLDEAVRLSLLHDVGPSREKNSAVQVDRYQLHPMLCPQFDLPWQRRGVLNLQAGEVSAIFTQDPLQDRYDEIRRLRLERVTPPFKSATPIKWTQDTLE